MSRPLSFRLSSKSPLRLVASFAILTMLLGIPHNSQAAQETPQPPGSTSESNEKTVDNGDGTETVTIETTVTDADGKKTKSRKTITRPISKDSTEHTSEQSSRKEDSHPAEPLETGHKLRLALGAWGGSVSSGGSVYTGDSSNTSMNATIGYTFFRASPKMEGSIVLDYFKKAPAGVTDAAALTLETRNKFGGHNRAYIDLGGGAYRNISTVYVTTYYDDGYNSYTSTDAYRPKLFFTSATAIGYEFPNRTYVELRTTGVFLGSGTTMYLNQLMVGSRF